MKASRFILVQFAVLGIALGVRIPSPQPNYTFGVTGEPMKVDTAFANLGELGPVYDLPEARNDSTATSRGNAQLSTTEELTTQMTEPQKILQATTAAKTETSTDSNVESTSTVKINGGAMTTLGSGSVNGTTSKEETFDVSTLPNPVQKFETTAVSKEKPTSLTTESGNNITSNPTNIITEETNSTGASSNSNTPSWTTPKGTATDRGNLQTTPQWQPSQNFHTALPNSTDTSTIITEGQKDTKPGRNSTAPSKPNSSFSIHADTGYIWITLTITYVCVMNIK